MVQFSTDKHVLSVENVLVPQVCPFAPMLQWVGIRCAFCDVCFHHAQHGVEYHEVVSSSRNGHPLAMLGNSQRGIPENPGNKHAISRTTANLSYDQVCYTSVTTHWIWCMHKQWVTNSKRLGARLASTCFQFKRKEWQMTCCIMYVLVLYRYIAVDCCCQGYFVNQI